jgi:acyl-CoA thioesterase-2
VNEADLYADTVAGVLELEEIDRNIYRGRNAATAKDRHHLYGGQVAAQALMAAGLTVDDDRLPHSLHGYFLRSGQCDRHVLFHVDPDRDGGSFSARHVSAIQDGKVIFSMLASFHRADNEDALDAMGDHDLPDPPPEQTTPFRDPLVHRHEVTVSETIDGHLVQSDCLWLRTAAPLPDGGLVHSCGLAYLSDFGSGFGRMGPDIGSGGPSLDHAMWFHLPGRADEWTLLNMRPRKATQVRGLYDATMRDLQGRLCAVVEQENLLRKGDWRSAAAGHLAE